MNALMTDLIQFLIGTAVLVWLSRKSLSRPDRHGFHRFFSWEAILILVILNREPWGTDPFSAHQMASWILMALSIALAMLGHNALSQQGKASKARDEEDLYSFERTTSVVSSGVFAYIRHPMYTSLLALTWGAYFQAPTLLGTVVAVFGSYFLLLTAQADEKECQAYFGETYTTYMQRTKRFIPFLL